MGSFCTILRLSKALPVGRLNGIQIGANKKVKYYADFLINDEIILETKVGTHFQKGAFMQLLSYLKTANKSLGILALFSPSGVRFKRIVN